MARKSRAKYAPGAPITKFDDLLKQRVVYVAFGYDKPFVVKPINKGWFMSWQLQFIDAKLKQRRIFYAVPLEKTPRKKS